MTPALLLALLAAGCAHRAALGDACADSTTRVVPLGWRFVNAYAVVGEGGGMLVDPHDPGETTFEVPAGTWRAVTTRGWHYEVDDREITIEPGGEARLLAQMEAAGLAPGDLKLIALTHGHADHAGGAAAMAAATGAMVAVGAGDAALLRAGRNPALAPTDWRGAAIKPTLEMNYPALEPAMTISAPSQVRVNLGAVSGELRVTGGHTEGAMVLVLDDGRAIVGDLIRGGMLAKRRPTRHFFHEDEAAANAALTALADEGVACFYPGHGGPLLADDVVRWIDRR